MAEIPPATIRVTAYEVSCIPEDNINRSAFTVRVEYRGDGVWVVRDHAAFRDADGNRSYGYSWRDGIQEPVTDEDFRSYEAGRVKWRARHYFTEPEALRIAAAVAPTLTCNRFTVADALRSEETTR